MIIGISTPSYNPVGAMLLRCSESTNVGGVTRRVSRVATLDGNSVVTDFGATNSDTTVAIRLPMTKTLDETLRLLIKQNPLLVLTTRLGCFLGAVESFYTDGGTGIISFLITKTLSE